MIAADTAHHAARIFGKETEIGFALRERYSRLRAIVKFLHQEKAEEADRGDNDENDVRIGNRVAAPSGERFAGRDRAERNERNRLLA
jgi:hypothetical protein